MPTTPFLAVYCGSMIGRKPAYADGARQIGAALGKHGLGMVYGGGQVGLMGVVADALLAEGGHVVGVIPAPLATVEIAHRGVTELIVVPDMHQRKAMMAERAAGFLTLPGGVGTFEEFFEVLTWAAIGLHEKPIGVLNLSSYFDPLLTLLDHGVDEGFINRRHRDLVVVETNPDSLVEELALRIGHVPALTSPRLPASGGLS